MSEDKLPENEKLAKSLMDLVWAWRVLSPLCVVLYLYLLFTTSGTGLKLCAAFLTLVFAASTAMAWRTEVRATQE